VTNFVFAVLALGYLAVVFVFGIYRQRASRYTGTHRPK
jgi:hypothetical protein